MYQSNGGTLIPSTSPAGKNAAQAEYVQRI